MLLQGLCISLWCQTIVKYSFSVEHGYRSLYLVGLFLCPTACIKNTRLSFLRNISSSEKILLLFGDTGNDSRLSVYNYNAKQ
nr:MAG TPA: hypothetical protein [Bacteriophage sp.]